LETAILPPSSGLVIVLAGQIRGVTEFEVRPGPETPHSRCCMLGKIRGQHRDSTACDFAAFVTRPSWTPNRRFRLNGVNCEAGKRLCRTSSVYRSKAHTGFERPQGRAVSRQLRVRARLSSGFRDSAPAIPRRKVTVSQTVPPRQLQRVTRPKFAHGPTPDRARETPRPIRQIPRS
jgi:hypothetical protein